MIIAGKDLNLETREHLLNLVKNKTLWANNMIEDVIRKEKNIIYRHTHINLDPPVTEIAAYSLSDSFACSFQF